VCIISLSIAIHILPEIELDRLIDKYVFTHAQSRHGSQNCLLAWMYWTIRGWVSSVELAAFQLHGSAGLTMAVLSTLMDVNTWSSTLLAGLCWESDVWERHGTTALSSVPLVMGYQNLSPPRPAFTSTYCTCTMVSLAAVSYRWIKRKSLVAFLDDAILSDDRRAFWLQLSAFRAHFVWKSRVALRIIWYHSNSS